LEEAMIGEWSQGTATVAALVDEGKLQIVNADRGLARALLAQAALHLTAAA
jgi:hypothetical protein